MQPKLLTPNRRWPGDLHLIDEMIFGFVNYESQNFYAPDGIRTRIFQALNLELLSKLFDDVRPRRGPLARHQPPKRGRFGLDPFGLRAGARLCARVY